MEKVNISEFCVSDEDFWIYSITVKLKQVILDINFLIYHHGLAL